MSSLFSCEPPQRMIYRLSGDVETVSSRVASEMLDHADLSILLHAVVYFLGEIGPYARHCSPELQRLLESKEGDQRARNIRQRTGGGGGEDVGPTALTSARLADQPSLIL